MVFLRSLRVFREGSAFCAAAAHCALSTLRRTTLGSGDSHRRLMEHNAQTATAASLIAMLASMSTPIACRMIDRQAIVARSVSGGVA